MKKLFSASLISLAFVSCGDDGGGGNGGGAVNIDDIINDLENPSGNVTTPEGAQGVADAFAVQQSEQTFGQRRDGITCDVNQMTGETACECSGGGSIEITSSGQAGGSASAHWAADSCCQGAAEGCCYDGTLDVLVNTEQGATYSLCYVYDIVLSQCKEATIYISYCQDSMGRQWWVVSYEGESFAVTGMYTEGVGGTWTIRDMDTTWNCTEDAAGAGCCSDEGGVEEDITWGGGVCL